MPRGNGTTSASTPEHGRLAEGQLRFVALAASHDDSPDALGASRDVLRTWRAGWGRTVGRCDEAGFGHDEGRVAGARGRPSAE
jgi:hypothetical protein